MICPSADDWMDIDSGLTDRQRLHIAECKDCRALVAILAKGSGSPADSPVELNLGLLSAGTQIGPYEVVGSIAAGGMGVVLEGYDARLQRKVALKAVRRDDGESISEKDRERLLIEARAMARLSHPNVVGIYELVEEGKELLIAMEFVQGSDLSVWKKKDPSHDECMRVLLEAASGVSAAHKGGIVHRDLKPGNILIADTGRVQVTDFGLASIRVGDKSRVVGTLRYAAPEVLAGSEADTRSDLYSLAATAKELFNTPHSKGRKSPLQRALNKAMAKDPSQRYASVAEFADALRRAGSRTRLVYTLLAIALLAIGCTSYLLLSENGKDFHCQSSKALLAKHWSTKSQNAFHTAMEPLQSDNSEKLLSLANQKWNDWASAASALCREHKKASPQKTEEVQACLDSRRLRLAASVFHAPAAKDADRVYAMLQQSIGPRLCEDTEEAPPSLSAFALKERRRIQSKLEEVSVISFYHDYVEARRRLEAILPQVPPEDRALRGEVLYRTADKVARTGDAEGAIILLEEALQIAEAEQNTIARLNSLVLLIHMHQQLGQIEKSLALVPLVEAAAQSAPSEIARDLRIYNLLASISYDRAEYKQAEVHYRRIVQMQEERWSAKGGIDAEVGGALSNLGMVLWIQGKADEAKEAQERSLAVFTKAVGADHSDTAYPQMGLAELALDAGDLPRAKELATAVRALHKSYFGEEFAYAAEEVLVLGRISLQEGDINKALAFFSEARGMTESLGNQHPLAAESAYYSALALCALGRHEEAAEFARRSLFGFEKSGLISPTLWLAEILESSYGKASNAIERSKVARRKLHTLSTRSKGLADQLDRILPK